MKKINIFISLIIVLVLLGAGFAQQMPRSEKAWKMQQKSREWGQHGKGMPDMKWWKNPRFAKELELTDDQLDKFYKLENNSRKKIIKVGADLAIKKIELKEAMEKPDFDESAIKKLINETVKLQGEIAKITMGAILSGLKILTKEQRTKLIKLRRKGGFRKQKAKGKKKSKD